MRIAVIADIHGNLPALAAVQTELERAAPDYVLVNGDLINGIPFSTAVIDEVRRQDWVVVRGNHEFYYLDFGTDRAAPGSEDPDRWGQLHWLVDQITPEQGNYLAMLPDERTFYLAGTAPLRIAHGVPGRNRVGFYNGQPAQEIVDAIQDVQERTLITAHTHLQIDRHIHWDPARQRTLDLGALQMDPHAGSHVSPQVNVHDHPRLAAQQPHAPQPHRHWHVINPGSVGLPLNGRPTAQYALLDQVAETTEIGGWRATHCEVAYDRRAALAEYHTSGMLEAGGVISRLFYWELVTAEAEIVLFYRWAWENGQDPDRAVHDAFTAYVNATGRDQYVRARDPLYQQG